MCPPAQVPVLLPGQTGAFVVRSRTKEHVRTFGIRKGMVLLDASLKPTATRSFTCDVLVLHSQTTMRVNYQPILYARNVRQCVRIVEMDKDILRTGVRARPQWRRKAKGLYVEAPPAPFRHRQNHRELYRALFVNSTVFKCD